MLQGESIDIDTTQFTAFGKDVIRTLNLHPDTFVQLALQYTYYRIYGRYMLPSCYSITWYTVYFYDGEPVRQCLYSHTDVPKR